MNIESSIVETVICESCNKEMKLVDFVFSELGVVRNYICDCGCAFEDHYGKKQYYRRTHAKQT